MELHDKITTLCGHFSSQANVTSLKSSGENTNLCAHFRFSSHSNVTSQKSSGFVLTFINLKKSLSENKIILRKMSSQN